MNSKRLLRFCWWIAPWLGIVVPLGVLVLQFILDAEALITMHAAANDTGMSAAEIIAGGLLLAMFALVMQTVYFWYIALPLAIVFVLSVMRLWDRSHLS